MGGVPPNALNDLKAKLKGLFKSKSKKPAEEKKDDVKPTETTNGAAPTETAPAPAEEPAAASAETPAAEPAAPAAPEPAKFEEPAAVNEPAKTEEPVAAAATVETPKIEPTPVAA